MNVFLKELKENFFQRTHNVLFFTDHLLAFSFVSGAILMHFVRIYMCISRVCETLFFAEKYIIKV